MNAVSRSVSRFQVRVPAVCSSIAGAAVFLLGCETLASTHLKERLCHVGLSIGRNAPADSDRPEAR